MNEDCSCGHRLSPASGYSNTQNHHFGGFNQSRSAFSSLEAHLFRGVGSDDGSDMLFANCQSDLGEQAAVLDIHDPADQLVAATDLAESATTGGDVAALELLGNQTVDFAFGYAVVAAGRFRRA